MIKKVLIANRGEIAVRIIRACRELSIGTIAVYSQADADSLHVLMADAAVCVGPAASKDSYLNMHSILTAAMQWGADAIHPGYGFLSENDTFASLCKKCGIKFIGPSASSIKLLGNKESARATMKAHGIPVIKGSDGSVDTLEEAIASADEIGYPIMVKAVSGGGGRGIRVAHNKGELETAYLNARTEAKACFGNDAVYLEQYLQDVKHIEIQILADSHGNVVHLGERDCSIQRRNQKIIEEAPFHTLDEKTRTAMGECAARAAKAVGYENAGTVEFLYDGKDFYFMEMNTRVQVEHPVTEMVTGLDIVKEQLRIASGLPMSFTQEDVRINGHSIECRVNAESPDKDFAPCFGKIDAILLPGGFGVRIDSHLYEGYKIPPFYDSMIAKIIVHDKTRAEAIRKMQVALEDFTIEGITTNIEYLQKILDNDQYKNGNLTTKSLAEMKL